MELTIELLTYVALVIMGIVPIINPFSTAPIFISLTKGRSSSERHSIALKACIYMAGLLLLFLIFGTYILQFFGISMRSLRMAGGLIIAFMGFRMLFPSPPSELPAATDTNGDSAHDLAFTPLALPMLCGPGSISVVLAMATEVSHATSITEQLVGNAVVGVGILLSAFICWLVLWSSGAVVRFLGKNGIDAATKLMGFFLICMGMEFLLSAWAMS